MTNVLETRASTRAEKTIRFMAVLLAVGIFFVMMTMSGALAAGGDASAVTSSAGQAIQEGIADGAEQLYSIMTAIVVPAAVVVVGWAALQVFFCGERGMEQAKKKMLTVVGVLALVFLAPVIVQQMAGWFLTNGSVNQNGVFTDLIS